jgi:predicted RNA polymerase sigma factor
LVDLTEAFLSNKETINKRLFRAKEKLQAEKISLEFPPENEIANRLDNVLHIIYLLFNEGYYSQTQNQILRKDLCLEALRLGIMLTESSKTNQPRTNALVTLMCFYASRFNARQSDEQSFILYKQEDESLWDKELIKRGNHYLEISANGSEISSYHLEAAIAFWHCHKEDTPEKWKNILHCYDLLLQINYSTSVGLNRIYALYKVKEKQAALVEAEQLHLPYNHFCFTLLGELYSGVNNIIAKEHFQTALSLAKTYTEKQSIRE